MNLWVTEEVHRALEQRVRTGEYPDASAVIAEALRLLERYERSEEGHRGRLARIVKEGLDDLTLGRTVRSEVVFAALKQRAAVMRGEA
jgi:putative addiction module CopG family antidote